jgi:hypothetical protein
MEGAMFTLEIGGMPIAITDGDEQEAHRVFEGGKFKSDMQRWMTGRGPVWDGKAAFRVRPATAEEVAQFQGPDPYPRHGSEEDHGPTIMFLVDAYDPDDLEED